MTQEKNAIQDLSLKLAILDDHKMIAEMLKQVLKKFPFVSSTEIFSESEAFFSHIDENKIDVLLLDVFMPDVDGLDVLKKCREKYDSSMLKIVVLSSSIDPEIISTALDNGVDAYLTKEDFASELDMAFQFIYKNPGRSYVSEKATDILLSDKADKIAVIRLSPREKQLLKFICDAKTAKEIAYELDLSVNTIYFYTKKLMVKMDVNRTQDLILKAVSLKLVSRK